MKIVVYIKHVPDTNEVKLDPVTNTLIRDGLPSIINHDDKSGIEAALRIKEQVGGDSTVTVVCMGPPQADVALREALAMGCDNAVLLSSREFGGSDTLATSTIVAAGVAKLDYDLVITGRQAIDGDTAQVGPQIAEHLGLPQVSYAEEVVEITNDYIVVKRQFEDRYHIIKVKLPCLITALAELAEPRYMSVAGIEKAYATDITVLDYEAMKDVLPLEKIGLNGSPTNVKRSFGKQAKGAGTVLADLTPDEAVQAIIAKLEEKYII
ncbi:MAG: electron transfer flavoprotein subunit beta/FixA family protein [Firmicutes bacterium]|nr:electron transfer flavoprotein subunit beta/FixA family protein [Bacillota bacterium]